MERERERAQNGLDSHVVCVRRKTVCNVPFSKQFECRNLPTLIKSINVVETLNEKLRSTFLFTLYQSIQSVSGRKKHIQNWATWSCKVDAATDWPLPALFMAGRAPFRAPRRFPPKGTYCWLRGKLSVFRSCLRCFSLKMEWTVFRKSFLLSGELREIEGHVISLSLCS